MADNVARDICAICRNAGADMPIHPSGYPNGPWAHSSCFASAVRREVLTQGKCCFCLDDGPDMAPYGPDDPDDALWAHRSCIALYEEFLGEVELIAYGDARRISQAGLN